MESVKAYYLSYYVDYYIVVTRVIEYKVANITRVDPKLL